jgi:hypothetical protein
MKVSELEAEKTPLHWRYRTEVLIHIAATGTVYFFSWLVKAWITDVNLRITLSLGLLAVLLLGINLFRQKYLIDSRFKSIEQLLFNVFGVFSATNQFFKRRGHWASEKQQLAQIFVNRWLPDVLEWIPNSSELKRINLILDSGTTITPIFQRLMASGILMTQQKMMVYTNNLAGIEEIHRMEDVQFREQKEDRIRLLTGKPLWKYRATIGADTLQALNKLFADERVANGRVFNIGVVTSNWILGGPSLNKLMLCARGAEHLEFKKAVVQGCDLIVVIAPLGKILRLGEGDLKKLNDWISNSDDRSRYENPFVLPSDKKKFCHLLTTLRSRDDDSPLVASSNRLKQIQEKDEADNFTVSNLCNYHELQQRGRDLLKVELPHEYIREHREDAYHCTV